MNPEPPPTFTFRQRLFAFFQLIRVQNLPTALADVWSGWILGSILLRHDPRFLEILFVDGRDYYRPGIEGFPALVRFFLPLSLGAMALYASAIIMNDLVDLERDRSLHPHRPLPAGKISLKVALTSSWILGIYGFACGLFAAGSWPFMILLSISVAGYTLIKARRLPAATTLGLARAANWMIGCLASYGYVDRFTYRLGELLLQSWMDLRPNMICIMLGVFSYAALLTWISFEEEQPGSSRLFRGMSVLFALCPLLTLVLSILNKDESMLPPALLAGSLSLLLARQAFRCWSTPTRAEIQRTVLIGVRGYPILHAAAVCAAGSGDGAAAILVLYLCSWGLGQVFKGS